MDSDEITPDSPLGDTERILAQAPVSRQQQVTKGSQQAPSKELKTAKTLMIWDATNQQDQQIGPEFAKYALKGAETKQVNSWQELSSLLQEYKSIDRLVLYFHGGPGSLQIGNEYKSLSEVAKQLKDKKLPTVSQQIDFEACFVGQGAGEIVPFARMFKAPKATAWNYWHVVQPHAIDIPQNVDIAILENKLAQIKDYLIENSPSASELAKRKPGRYYVFAEWFKEQFPDPNEELPPPPAPTDPVNRRDRFKSRRSAREKSITSDEAAKLIYPPAGVPFEHVVISKP